jgi:hypothetical protein
VLALLATVASTTPATLQGGASPAPPPACDSPEFHQFDFWIGRWDVIETRTGKTAGRSLVEQMYQGCALRENWSEPGFTGGSLNHYVPGEKRWRQTWTDSAGAWREFSGGLRDGRMVLVARQHSRRPFGPATLVRMTFTANPDGTVRQYSDLSPDDGASWSERYDYTYKPLKPVNRPPGRIHRR